MRDDFDKKLDTLLYTIAQCIIGAKSKEAGEGEELWPCNPIHPKLFFVKEWFSKLLHCLKKLEERGYSDESIAELFYSSSRIAQCFWNFAVIREVDLRKEEKIYLAKKLLKLLSIYRKRDIFCKKGSNIIWDEEKVKKTLKGLDFIEKKEFKDLIWDLEAELWLYTELIWFFHHPLGHPFHGPYKVNQKRLIVREYFDLRPISIWEFTRKLSFENITIFETYKKSAQFKIDFMERGFQNTEGYRDKFTGFFLRVDGRELNTKEEIREVKKNLEEVIDKGTKFIQNLDLKEMFFRHAKGWFYILKPLCDALKMDWAPPQEVYVNFSQRWNETNKIWEKIETQRIKKSPSSRKQAIKEIMLNFDPQR